MQSISVECSHKNLWLISEIQSSLGGKRAHKTYLKVHIIFECMNNLPINEKYHEHYIHIQIQHTLEYNAPPRLAELLINADPLMWSGTLFWHQMTPPLCITELLWNEQSFTYPEAPSLNVSALPVLLMYFTPSKMTLQGPVAKIAPVRWSNIPPNISTLEMVTSGDLGLHWDRSKRSPRSQWWSLRSDTLMPPDLQNSAKIHICSLGSLKVYW